MNRNYTVCHIISRLLASWHNTSSRQPYSYYERNMFTYLTSASGQETLQQNLIVCDGQGASCNLQHKGNNRPSLKQGGCTSRRKNTPIAITLPKQGILKYPVGRSNTVKGVELSNEGRHHFLLMISMHMTSAAEHTVWTRINWLCELCTHNFAHPS